MQILAIGLAMLVGVETATEVANINPTAHTVQAARRRYRRRRRRRVLDRTKIYTSTRPVIIGNRRSHIYHVVLLSVLHSIAKPIFKSSRSRVDRRVFHRMSYFLYPE